VPQDPRRDRGQHANEPTQIVRPVTGGAMDAGHVRVFLGVRDDVPEAGGA
jgi:hypothetical protein